MGDVLERERAHVDTYVQRVETTFVVLNPQGHYVGA